MMKVKHVAHAVAGGALTVVGVALLVLPGPGLLVVLAGLVLLSSAFPRLERYVEPVRARAMKAAQESVASPWRVGASVLAGSALVGTGLALGLMPGLPFSGWHTGSSVILSGIILFSLLIYTLARRGDRR